ncbi:peptidase M24 [Thermodesulfomicrobium sp. WS]|uniref:M24 family metallopeptidase n=1 Tax=Thermodesulfomicrobium sp. WS TaxID=3004129 RepID=UPI00249054FD|nr:aminopeptidase P family protein [Thermodesulfomicrobium sp. WS]BDU99956.1 peptidase M24 [Thermodesulfomicrobium sp. WS]
MNDYALRRTRLQAAMEANGVRSLLVSAPANRYYLSGFELHDTQCNESSGVLLIRLDGPEMLFTDARFAQTARECLGPDSVALYRRRKDLAAMLCDLGVTELWVEEDALCVREYRALAEKIPLHPAPPLVEGLRRIKSAEEIRLLRASAAVNHRVFARVTEMLRHGITEAELAWELERSFREAGAEALSFPTIVGFGPNGAKAHAIPGSQRLEPETPVLVDMGCRLQDYCSDQTRSFWFGSRPSPEFSRALNLVQEAQAAAIEAIAPGVPCAEVDRVAREFLARHGVAEHFTHSLGHGIGLETHEAPRLAAHDATILEPGMVVTVEPGLYFPWGGVRWEYMVVVTATGHEVL